MIVFSGGIVESATAIIGAYIADFIMPAWSVTIASTALFIIFLFIASQLLSLYRFYWSFRKACWMNDDPPESYHEMDDPVLALLCRLRLIRPRNRARGGWVLPEEDAVEPHRTELNLAKALDFGCGFRTSVASCCHVRKEVRSQRSGSGGERLERLQMWTRDGTSSPAGVAFGFVMISIQFALSTNTGLLYVHPWARTTLGQKVRLGINAGIQLTSAIFAAGPAANDILHGLGISVVFLLEGAATLCLLVSTLIMDGSSPADFAVGNASLVANNASDVFVAASANASAAASSDEEAHLARVAQALQLARIAARILSFSIFVPLALTVYDGIMVPIVEHMRHHDGTLGELACSLLVSFVVLPIQAAKFILGINADLADIASEYTDESKDVVSTKEEVDAPEEPMARRRTAVVAPLTPAEMEKLTKVAEKANPPTWIVEDLDDPGADSEAAPASENPEVADLVRDIEF